MLESILGSVSCERVLIYIHARGEGYGREIARFYDTDLDPIQKQLDKLELGGVLSSRPDGRRLLFSFNPNYPFLDELKVLLEKALSLYPAEVRERLGLRV
jgi:hypothetical protein